MSLNQRDRDILNILYRTGEPMTVTNIVHHGTLHRGTDLTQSTVMSVLRGLLKKGLVEVADIVYSGNVLSRAYRPTPAAKAAVLECFTELYGSVHNVVSPEELLESIRHLGNSQDHTVTGSRQQDPQDAGR